MIHKCFANHSIETRIVPRNDQTKMLQLSIHDTINARITHLNKAQLKILIQDLQHQYDEM